MQHVVRVNVPSRDRACRIDADGECALAGACACALGVDRRNRAVGIAQENVSQTVRVSVKSHDRASCGDAEGLRALPRACARARSVKYGDLVWMVAKLSVGAESNQRNAQRGNPRGARMPMSDLSRHNVSLSFRLPGFWRQIGTCLIDLPFTKRKAENSGESRNRRG